jgi:hypothetical protein
MPLALNMNGEQIKIYLLDDLKNSVINDIKPCLNLASQFGGYFAVPRLVLSYIDYLGTLYRSGHGAFLEKVFGNIDSNYKTYGRLFWEIYRNGLIHRYEPSILRNSGQEITWLVHKGDRQALLQNGLQLIHLRPQKINTQNWKQPISIKCLYYDLLDAIDHYALLVSQNFHIEDNFRNAANRLQQPTETTLQWW